MKRVVIAGVLVASAAFPAVAADLPVKAPMVAPAAFTWSGCYVGGNAGGVNGRSTFSTSPGGAYLTAAGVAAPPNAAGTGLLAGDLTSARHSYDDAKWGWTAGGQVGCNWQAGRSVFGVEADFNWARVTVSANAFYPAFPSVSTGGFTISQATETLSNRMDWFSTLRARAGLVVDHWLVYGTVGLAIGHFRSTTNIAYGANGTSPVFANSLHVGAAEVTRLGAALGAGLEYAFDNNWSLKAEYLFLYFGGWSYNAPLIAPGGVAAGYLWTTGVTANEHVVRFGLNYRIGAI